MLGEVRDAMSSVCATTNGDGIKADGSFHQHGPQLYTGGYGGSFANDVYAEMDTIQFSTKSGRKIFAGGGVCPDVQVNSPQLDLLRKIDRLSLALQWASSKVATAGSKFTSFEKFQQEFKIDDTMIAEFTHDCAEHLLDSQLMSQNTDFLRTLLKSEIAKLKWGLKESLLISKDIDPIIRTAVAEVPESEKLLTLNKK